MRMPLLSYFTAVGAVLVGLLFWVSSEIEPESLSLKTSQIVGLPKPFKAPPEARQYKITGVNFAAEYQRRPTRSTKIVDAAPRMKMASKYSTPTGNRLAEYPHSSLSIH
jgi:hypothetical protein